MAKHYRSSLKARLIQFFAEWMGLWTDVRSYYPTVGR